MFENDFMKINKFTLFHWASITEICLQSHAGLFLFFRSLTLFDVGGKEIVPAESIFNTILSVFLMDSSKRFLRTVCIYEYCFVF
tara:strand:- start:117559 stop:117810 length:252 start_codon:yes stop_codon:yes gene_type:complete